MKKDLTIRVAAWYDSSIRHTGILVKEQLEGWKLLQADMERLGVDGILDRDFNEDYYSVKFKNIEDRNFYLIAGNIKMLIKTKASRYYTYYKILKK